MARKRTSGIGCGTVLLAALVVSAFAVWQFGIADWLIYQFQMQHERETIQHSSPVESAGSAFVAQQPQTATESFVYSQLSQDDKAKYDVLLDAFRTREERAYPQTDQEDLSRVRDCVMADHPELFAVRGVHMLTTTNLGSGLVTRVTVEGEFSCSAEEEADIRARVDEAANACLSAMPAQADDYGAAKYLFEYLATTTEYDHSASDPLLDVTDAPVGQTIADALISRRAVCAGYARAYQYLLQRLEIPCVYVTGMAQDGNHAWCSAYLDGFWYFIDPTWGDPQFFDDGGNSADAGIVDYDYLCVTGADMAPTHRAECAYPVPECISMSDNYYVREGLYLDQPDVGYVGAVIEGAVARGESSVRYRAATRVVFDELVARLLDAQEIYRYLPANFCRYSLNDDLLTMTVHVSS